MQPRNAILPLSQTAKRNRRAKQQNRYRKEIREVALRPVSPSTIRLTVHPIIQAADNSSQMRGNPRCQFTCAALFLCASRARPKSAQPGNCTCAQKNAAQVYRALEFAVKEKAAARCNSTILAPVDKFLSIQKCAQLQFRHGIGTNIMYWY